MEITAEEELLLARCVKREPEALKNLAALYGPPVFGFLYSVLGTKAYQCKDDFLQAFHTALENYIPYEQKRSYLASVLEELLLLLKKRKVSEQTIQFPSETPSRQTLLCLAFTAISWQDRLLILLRDQLRLSLDEISEVTHSPIDLIKTQLKDARVQFRSAIGEKMKVMETLGRGMPSHQKKDT